MVYLIINFSDTTTATNYDKQLFLSSTPWRVHTVRFSLGPMRARPRVVHPHRRRKRNRSANLN